MIYVGTSGYSFPDWIGEVYPKEISKPDMLKYYCHVWNFNAVELNFTYYASPSYKTIVSMLRKTPSHFVFSVKLPASVTHEGWKSQSFPQDDVKKLLDALIPMVEENRLKMLLAQFPYSFRDTPENRRYLQLIHEKIELPTAIEFRHASWNNEGIYKLLESCGFTFVVVDEPNLRELFPYVPITTSDKAYFRFHGRNKNWFTATEGERYNYKYSVEEISNFAKDVIRLAQRASDVFVFFNNCYRGNAVRDAISLRHTIENILFES
ncbi:DUF72 domain-containing protein [Pseudothermotoga sp.]|uniref:DUF72 domain-containing protein n=1 Tax=Pseudothermotoga sp. TaxID=2033661 RepID=UPI0031F673F8